MMQKRPINNKHFKIQNNNNNILKESLGDIYSNENKIMIFREFLFTNISDLKIYLQKTKAI